MVDSDIDADADRVSRRRILEGLGVATAGALAGCTGDESGGDGSGGGDEGASAGERVPTIELEYWSDMGSYTQVFEGSLPGITNNIEEHLGLSVETVPVAFTTQINNNFQDKRTHDISYWTHSLAPDRLDPFEFTWRFNATWAGANGSGNPNNYADCTHSLAALRQGEATSESERRELTNEAFGKMSEDIGSIPVAQILRFGAYDNDTVTANSLGSAGLQLTGYRSVINSETSEEALNINANPVTSETRTHLVINSTQALSVWNHLFYSTLTEYNEDYELENVLAEDYEVRDDGTTFEVSLREDMQFHNGNEITAEDVKWTFEFISDNASNYPKASQPPYESIDVIDEKTVIFNTSESFLPLITRIWPRWGVMPKDVWQSSGAEENPRDVDLDPIVGSGPYKITNFEQGQIIQAEPHDGHPRFSPSQPVNVNIFQDSQSAFRAFQNEEINLFLSAPVGIANEIRETMDNAEVVPTNGYLPYVFYPQMSHGPFQHRELRMAWSQAIDRNAANQTALYGDSEPLLHSSAVTPKHPWYAGDENLTQIAETASSNPEVARAALTDAGYSFDGDGNLRYPEDIDLGPQWPEGSQPSEQPDAFPCMDELQQ